VSAFIVTEGESDATLLKAVLAPVITRAKARLLAAHGRSDAISLAQSLLVARKDPVALIIDADTSDPSRIAEERVVLEEMLRSVGVSAPHKVVLAVPVIESCLFEAPGVLEETFATRLSPEELMEARFQPKQVLQRLAQGRALDYSSLLAGRDLTAIRRTRVMREIREFLEAAVREVAAIGAS
jgi:hypothetical protein